MNRVAIIGNGTPAALLARKLAGLGYTPAGERSVTPVPSWALGLVPKPSGTNETIKDEEDTEADTIPLIVSKIRRTLHHTKKLAQRLKGKDLRSTAQNDFNFIFKHIKYVEDEPGQEQVRSPRRLIHEGKGDCDCFTVTLSSLLINQRIPHFLRIMKQNAGDEWSHIYIVVPKSGRVDKKLTDRSEYIVVDCVTHKFDYEAPQVQHKDFPMALQSLDGIGEADACKTGAGSFQYYERAQQYRDRGLVITEEFLQANKIPYTVEDGKVFGYRVGVTLVPAVITPDQAQTLLNPAVYNPAEPEPSNEGEARKKNYNALWWLLGGAAVVYAFTGTKKDS